MFIVSNKVQLNEREGKPEGTWNGAGSAAFGELFSDLGLRLLLNVCLHSPGAQPERGERDAPHLGETQRPVHSRQRPSSSRVAPAAWSCQ